MFGWVNRAWKFVRGLPRDTSALIHRIFHAIIGWATNIFGIISGVWDTLAATFHHWYTITEQFLGELVAHIAKIVTHTIPDLIRAIYHDLGKVADDLTNLARDVWKKISDAIHYAEKLVTDALTWVKDNVYKPLANDLTAAWDWIKKEGAAAYYYATHPEVVLFTVSGWLWHHLLSLMRNYTESVIRWAIGNATSTTLDIASVIETAITDVL